jgi:hypothetical protein
MESAPVTWNRISGKADDVCDALLYIVRHGRVSRFLDPILIDETRATTKNLLTWKCKWRLKTYGS